MARLALALLLLWTTGAGAATGSPVVSPGPGKIALSIYHLGTVDTQDLAQSMPFASQNGGLALISETRSVELPAGPVDIQFRGVAGTMVPQTATMTGLPQAIAESNFDFDLLSPGTLLAKSVGQTVHLVRTDRKTGRETRQDAILVSGPNGVMLKIGDHYEALGCSGAPERVVFDQVPGQLFDTPTFSIHAIVPRAGRYTLTLRYLATGMNWSADYVARVDEADGTLDLSGWLTLANFSESSFAGAAVDVIAGHVNTTGGDRPVYIYPDMVRPDCWPTQINWNSTFNSPFDRSGIGRVEAAGPVGSNLVTVTGTSLRDIEARDLGDYKLYPLNEPTNVAARQTKQVQFLESRRVPFSRVYRAGTGSALDLDPGTGIASAILLRLDNSEQGKLGKPLPAGGVSVFSEAGGAPFLTAEDRIDDVAVGLPVEIVAGQTMAVRAQAQVLDRSPIQRGQVKFRRSVVEITAINDKAEAANFEWHQARDRAGMALVSESRAHGARNGDLVWAIPLKSGEHATFRYTLDVPD